MPTFLLDNKEIEFTLGQTIIEAARDAGIEIPHFCWHPAMSVAGNCRVCLVEVEKMPKGVIACATLAAEGMVVHAESPRAVHMRNAIMEFLLINHPLDCPICDEAGECKLQDYAYKYSVGSSRFDELKTHKDKRVELGPNVMFDGERCISCSLCIRFCDEIAGKPQLTFIERGEHVTITTFPGEPLDNDYSMNVIDICPVGALTSRDFRFKARRWDLADTESICIGCARGCNMNIWTRDNEILRLTPRENPDVNQYWMCDNGRLNTFKFVNDADTRVNSPMMRPDSVVMSDDQNMPIECGWDAAISKVISELKNYQPDEIGFIASPLTTLEDNFVLKRFANEVVETENIVYIPHIVKGDEDNLLIREDKSPNAAGLKHLGIKPIDKNFIDKVLSKQIKLLYVVHDSLDSIEQGEEMRRALESGILHVSNLSTNTRRATVIFPTSTYAEMNGTLVNFQNRVQRIRSAVATLEQERLPGDFSMSRLDKFGAHNDTWTRGTKFNARPAWNVISQIANAMGGNFSYMNTEDVFDDIASKVKAFAGMDYEQIGNKGMLIGKAEKVIA